MVAQQILPAVPPPTRSYWTGEFTDPSINKEFSLYKIKHCKSMRFLLFSTFVLTLFSIYLVIHDFTFEVDTGIVLTLSSSLSLVISITMMLLTISIAMILEWGKKKKTNDVIENGKTGLPKLVHRSVETILVILAQYTPLDLCCFTRTISQKSNNSSNNSKGGLSLSTFTNIFPSNGSGNSSSSKGSGKRGTIGSASVKVQPQPSSYPDTISSSNPSMSTGNSENGSLDKETVLLIVHNRAISLLFFAISLYIILLIRHVYITHTTLYQTIVVHHIYLIPVFHFILFVSLSPFLRSLRVLYAMTLMDTLAVMALTLYANAWFAVAVLVALTDAMYLLIRDKHTHIIQAFLHIRYLHDVIQTTEKNAIETQATEMRHMIANVAHDLKTVSIYIVCSYVHALPY